jgi:hypothetical protein
VECFRDIETSGNLHVIIRIKDDTALLNELLSIIVET